jgi:hypothetical protein
MSLSHFKEGGQTVRYDKYVVLAGDRLAKAIKSSNKEVYTAFEAVQVIWPFWNEFLLMSRILPLGWNKMPDEEKAQLIKILYPEFQFRKFFLEALLRVAEIQRQERGGPEQPETSQRTPGEEGPEPPVEVHGGLSAGKEVRRPTIIRPAKQNL